MALAIRFHRLHEETDDFFIVPTDNYYREVVTLEGTREWQIFIEACFLRLMIENERGFVYNKNIHYHMFVCRSGEWSRYKDDILFIPTEAIFPNTSGSLKKASVLDDYFLLEVKI